MTRTHLVAAFGAVVLLGGLTVRAQSKRVNSSMLDHRHKRD
jgi:hypothetical protein